MTEAAQAHPGGLECSSYTWQVRQLYNAAFRTECQGVFRWERGERQDAA